MIISTWNINGIKSATRSGFESWLKEVNPDVLCLQETKMEPDLLTQQWFSGYVLEIFPAQKKGYSGTAILHRKSMSPISIIQGIGVPEFDIEGRVISAEFEKFELLSIYAPHSHRELINLDKKIRFFDSLIEYLEKKPPNESGKPTILTGDFNVAFEKRDVFHHSSNRGNAGFHDSERKLFGHLLDLGYVDALRVLNPNAGIYSWWSLLPGVKEKNVGWRLDYILVNTSMKSSIVNCFHSPDATGSDHCPVTVHLDL